MKNLNSFKNRALPTISTVIATIAIIWYVFTSFEVFTNWWALPTMAAITAILAKLLPFLAKRIKPLSAIISTGFTVLIMQSVLPLILEGPQYLLGNLIILICSVGIVTELLTYSKVHAGDFVINLAISVLASWLITNSNNNCIAILIILFIAFVLMLVINFKFHFGIKHSRTNNTTTE